MSDYKKYIKPIFIATLWIGASEFIRNQLVFASFWTDHYHSLGIEFPAKPINGMVWMLWSLSFAGVVAVISTKFTLKQTTALCWIIGFMLMWLVIGNLGVLPTKLLWFAVPLSLVESYGASYIAHYFQRKNK